MHTRASGIRHRRPYIIIITSAITLTCTSDSSEQDTSCWSATPTGPICRPADAAGLPPTLTIHLNDTACAQLLLTSCVRCRRSRGRGRLPPTGPGGAPMAAAPALWRPATRTDDRWTRQFTSGAKTASRIPPAVAKLLRMAALKRPRHQGLRQGSQELARPVFNVEHFCNKSSVEHLH